MKKALRLQICGGKGSALDENDHLDCLIFYTRDKRSLKVRKKRNSCPFALFDDQSWLKYNEIVFLSQ